MRLIFSKRHEGAKAVSDTLVKSSQVLVLSRLALLLSLITLWAGCNTKIAPAGSGGIKREGFDTTLYNLTFLEAARQKMLGNTGDAVNYYEQALAINPESDGAAYEISRISFGRGDLENATKYGQIAIKIDENNIWYLNHLATLYFSKNSVDSVIIVFEKIVSLYPENEDILFNLGGLYLETGRAAEAEKIFSGFRSKYGENEQIVFALLNAMNAQNKETETTAILWEMIDAEPENTTYKGMLAENYRKYGSPDKAVEIYNELFNRDPDNPLLHLSYIDFLIEEDRFGELAESVDHIMMNDSIEKAGKINILLSLAENTTYITSFKNQLLMSALIFEANYKEDSEVMFVMATIYGKLGENQKETEKLTEWAEKDPGNYSRWEHLLIKVNEGGDTDLLYKLCERVSREFNIYPLPKLLLAFAATERAEYERALTETSKVRILVNEQKEFMIQILSLEGDIYYRQGVYDKAFQRFEEALIISPDDAMILNNYAYFLSEQDRDLKRAEQLIVKCLGLVRNNTYLDTHAWVLYKLRKFRQAKSVMEEIFKEEITDAELLEHYGYIQKALGNCDEAIRLWDLSLISDASKNYLIEAIEGCSGKK